MCVIIANAMDGLVDDLPIVNYLNAKDFSLCDQRRFKAVKTEKIADNLSTTLYSPKAYYYMYSNYNNDTFAVETRHTYHYSIVTVCPSFSLQPKVVL